MPRKPRDTRVIKFPSQKPGGRDASTFGKTLREFRLKSNVDADLLAKSLGVSRNTISNWECGVSRPDLAMLPELCELLHMSLYDFYRIPEPDPHATDERHIIADYREMTDANKRQFHKVADAILESQEEMRYENAKRNYCLLKLHDLDLSAGVGFSVDEEPVTSPIFVRSSRFARMADDIFPINGHSMEPDYPDGSMVFVKRVPDASAISFGDVIACTVSGTPYVKIYAKDGLRSINKEYATIHVSSDDTVILLGRVIGAVPEIDLVTEEEERELREIFADELK